MFRKILKKVSRPGETKARMVSLGMQRCQDHSATRISPHHLSGSISLRKGWYGLNF